VAGIVRQSCSIIKASVKTIIVSFLSCCGVVSYFFGSTNLNGFKTHTEALLLSVLIALCGLIAISQAFFAEAAVTL
jgi:hypothetical protein